MRNFFSLVAKLKGIFAERFDKSPIMDRERLCRFLHTRAAYIAQESLYGYLKTRMGTQFPQYFEDAEFSRGIRMAALKLFVSCLSDLTVFAVATVARRAADVGENGAEGGAAGAGGHGAAGEGNVAAGVADDSAGDAAENVALAWDCFQRALREGYAAAGEDAPPADAFARFDVRLANTRWPRAAEGENAFAGSAEDVLRYAPVIEEFKKLDRVAVTNSIRFRWRDVRDQFRRRVAADAILADWRRGRSASS